MRLTTDQHVRIALAFETAAASETLPQDLREEFWLSARKFRILANLAAKKEAELTVPSSDS
jgi:hypothetical protein